MGIPLIRERSQFLLISKCRPLVTLWTTPPFFIGLNIHSVCQDVSTLEFTQTQQRVHLLLRLIRHLPLVTHHSLAFYRVRFLVPSFTCYSSEERHCLGCHYSCGRWTFPMVRWQGHWTMVQGHRYLTMDGITGQDHGHFTVGMANSSLNHVHDHWTTCVFIRHCTRSFIVPSHDQNCNILACQPSGWCWWWRRR